MRRTKRVRAYLTAIVTPAGIVTLPIRRWAMAMGDGLRWAMGDGAMGTA